MVGTHPAGGALREDGSSTVGLAKTHALPGVKRKALGDQADFLRTGNGKLVFAGGSIPGKRNIAEGRTLSLGALGSGLFPFPFFIGT